jgi:hypothetical protein
MQSIFRYCKKNQIRLGFALCAAVLSITSNLSGVGWSWDTSDYVAVGKKFAKDLTLLDATGLPMTVRPPGLSILIAVGEWLGLGVNFTVQILNAVSAVIVVLCTSYLLQLANTRKFVTATATAFVAVSTALLWQYSMIWSEPPFIAVLMIAIVVSLRKMTATKVMSLTFLFITLFFIRYVGPVFAAAITATSIYFGRRQLGWLKSVGVNVLALGVSFIPVWWWLDRNQDIDGTLTGARVPGGGTLLSPLKTFTSTIGSWIFAKPVEGGIYLSWDSYPQNTKVIGTLFVVGFFVLCIVYLVTMLQQRHVPQDFNIFIVSATVLFTYVAFSAYRFVHFELGPLDNRMMIPIYVPMVLIIAITVDKIKIKPKPLRLAFAGLFTALVALQTFSSINDSIKFGQDGRYWAARDFIDQPLHKFVDSLPTNSLLMSNQPQQLFAVWQKSSVLNQYQLDAAQATPCENRYFVWYNSTYDDGTPNLEGQPEGAEVLFSDPIGSILNLGRCDANIATYWP